MLPANLVPLLCAASLIMSGLALFAWRARSAPTARPFAVAMAAAGVWALSYALELASPALADKVFWLQARLPAVAILPVAGAVLAARYARRPKWLAGWRLAAVLVIPALTVAVDWLAVPVFRFNYRLAALGPLTILVFDRGPWLWLYLLNAYGLAALTVTALLRALGGSPTTRRTGPTLTVAVTTLGPLILDALYQIGLTPLPGINLAPVTFSFTGLLLAWALFRYHILDLVPIARSLLVDRLADVMVVVDERGRVVDVNPAAAAVLGPAARPGQPAREALAAWPELLAVAEGAAAPAEIQRVTAAGPRTYDLAVMPLADRLETLAGQLLVLRDITERVALEGRLRDESARLRQLLDLAPFPLVLTRLTDGEVLYFSRRAEVMFGFPAAEVVGRPARNYYEDQDDRLALVEEARRAGVVTDHEARLLRAGGEPFWALISATVSEVDGQPVLLVGLSDITERKRVELIEREQRALAEALRDTAAALNTLDFEAVLDRLLANVGRVVPHDTANVMLIDDQGAAGVVRGRGYVERGLAEALTLRLPVATSAVFQQMLATGEPLVVSDIAADPEWTPGPSQRWIRSYAGMPIQIKGRVVGFLNLESGAPGFFTAWHAERLRAFADQAAAAIANARLYAETHRRAEEVAGLNRINAAITAGLDLESVLRALLEECLAILPLDAFYVAVYDAATGFVRHPLFYDRGLFHAVPPRDIRRQPGLSGQVITERRTLVVADMLDPAVAAAYPTVQTAGEPSRSYVGVPLFARGDVIGVISMQSYRPRAFSPEQVRLLENIAVQAALTIENTRLYMAAQAEVAERRQAEESLRRANAQLHVQLAVIEDLQVSLREQAIRDALTGLFNRRYLEEVLGQELVRAARENYPISVVLMDVDRFKALNDTHGHPAGDQVLRALGQALLANIRRSDIACRYGGEEFVVLLPGAPLAVALKRAEAWRAAFAAAPLAHNGQSLRCTFSAGVAVYPDHGAEGEAVLQAADRALYAAKAAGRNCIRVAG